MAPVVAALSLAAKAKAARSLLRAGAAVAFGSMLSFVMLLTLVAGGQGISAQLRAAAVPAQYAQWVIQAGNLCQPASAPLIAAQIDTESGWNPRAVSPRGAEGIAQFMPGTWRNWGYNANNDGSADPFDPADAIMSMGRYDCGLAQQVASVPGNLQANMLAAYNAGPGAVIAAGGIPPIPETQHYVQNITSLVSTYTNPTGGPPTSFAAAEIGAAAKQLNVPYTWGGGGPTGPTPGIGRGQSTTGFDCSGLVVYAVFQASGGKTVLPHSSEIQATMGTAVPRSQMRPGDVIAFEEHPGDYGHIGIYIGQNQMLDAPHTGATVRIESLTPWEIYPWAIRRLG